MLNNKNCTKISLLLVLLTLPLFILPLSADTELSTGIDVLANDFSMAVSGIAGTEVRITENSLKTALGVEDVGKITVVSLPDTAAGRLQLGSRYVEVGQTITQKNLSKLKFVPFGNGEISTSFTFCRGTDVYGALYTCNIYTTVRANTAPYFDSIKTSASATAYSGIIHSGILKATDSEGDSLTYEILSSPSNGKVRMTDKVNGYYEYTSNAGFTGNDSFLVRAYDKYGNYSPTVKLIIQVSPVKDGEVYSDMSGHTANEAVIACVRRNVIEAASEGTLFHPDTDVSRAEFLALTMKAAGYTGLTSSNTGFADDEDIPSEYKGCIAAAKAFGFINGVETEAGLCFCPNNRITRLEAAVILSRITGISGDGTVAVSADEYAVPAWATNAVDGMYEIGALRRDRAGFLNAYTTVTRGEAAQMICACMDISK